MSEAKLMQEGYMYVDSFRNRSDAEFRVSMYESIGLEAKIATLDINGQNLYRVYMKEV